MLHAYPVVDWNSYRLNDYFTGAVHELDAACRRHINMMYIGDPELCGAIHRSQRKAALARRDMRDSAAYGAQALHPGWEKWHRLGEMATYRKRFRLTDDDVPCIPILSTTGRQPLAILPIRPAWFDRNRSMGILDRVLREWLPRDEVVRVASAKASDLVLRSALKPLIHDVVLEIDAAIGVPNSELILSPAGDPIAESAILAFSAPTGQVFYKGYEVGLTEMQFSVLAALARNAGMWISRETLITQVIGETVVDPIAWLKNHVFAVRQAFRGLIDTGGITVYEIDGLIEAAQNRVILNVNRREISGL